MATSKRASSASGVAVETVKIAPSPRILKVLAEIDFTPWQCIAELIDNSLDEFQDAARQGTDAGGSIRVELPNGAAGTLSVVDDGRGMTLERITDAVSAGYSSNDPFSKLGLFGMGFNVATARLGDLTKFLSTREGDDEWVGVEIDLGAMPEDFSVPVVREPKKDPAEHGTRIEITHLNPPGLHFTRGPNRTRVRTQLGGIYSHLISEKGYTLTVDGIEVKPWRHCVWSPERTVRYKGADVAAVAVIDEPLTSVAACRSCGTWQEELDAETCERCGSKDLIARERRVHGWLGIARELSSKEYGIDFLRNGRKILRFDKSLFNWSDPDDPSGASQVEYPIEIPANLGRVVGEIHVDHVPVLYTKDGFDTGHRSWKHAVRVVRGDGPLRPGTRSGDETNDSPLALLFGAYRRNDPGRRYLTVGDGKSRRDTSAWVAKYHEGIEEYQTDEKWWDALLEHEKIAANLKRQREKAKEEQDNRTKANDEDPTREFTTPTDDEEDLGEQSGDDASAAQADHELTYAERIERLIDAGRPMPELKAEYTARGVPGAPVPLEAVAVSVPVMTETGERTPVLLHSRPRGAFVALIDERHPLFDTFDDDPADIVLMALAQQMLVRRNAVVPIGALFAELKDRYLSSKAIDPSRLQPEANQLLGDIQQRMVACVTDDPERPWKKALADHERAQTAERIATILRTDDSEKVIACGDYLPIMPASAVPRVIREWPEAFLDGRLFTAPYSKLEPGPAEQVIGQVIGLLNDVAWIASSPMHASREELSRARLALEILPLEIADGS